MRHYCAALQNMAHIISMQWCLESEIFQTASEKTFKHGNTATPWSSNRWTFSGKYEHEIPFILFPQKYLTSRRLEFKTLEWKISTNVAAFLKKILWCQWEAVIGGKAQNAILVFRGWQLIDINLEVGHKKAFSGLIIRVALLPRESNRGLSSQSSLARWDGWMLGLH